MTGLTTYTSNGKLYKRYFHTDNSIQQFLLAAGFSIQHIKTYQEQLCSDFQRKQSASFVDALIEVLAAK